MSEPTADNNPSNHDDNKSRCKKQLYGFSKFFYTRTCLELSSTVYIAVQYNTLPELPELYAALTHVIDTNPALALQVFTDEENADINANSTVVNGETVKADPPSNVYAAQVDSIDFAKLIKVDKSIDINDPVTHASFIERRFEFGNANKPLWEVLLIKDNYLVFKYDHTFFDGISGTSFLTQLVSYLNQNCATLSTVENQHIYYPKHCTDPDDLGMINVYEKSDRSSKDAVKETNMNKIKTVFESAIKTVTNAITAGPSLDRYKCEKYTVQRNTFTDTFVQANIPQEDVLKLIKLCKKNGPFTMNSLICSLISVASKNAFGTGEQAIKFVAPANIRAECGLDPAQIGLMIKAMEIVTPPLKDELVPSPQNSDMKPFWDFANNIHSSFTTGMASKQGIESIGSMESTDILSMLKEKEGKTTDVLFGATNLGLQFHEFSSKDSDKLKYYIKNCTFSQPSNCLFAFTCSFISTLDGGTNLQFTSAKSVKKEVEETVANFELYLRALIKIAKPCSCLHG